MQTRDQPPNSRAIGALPPSRLTDTRVAFWLKSGASKPWMNARKEATRTGVPLGPPQPIDNQIIIINILIITVILIIPQSRSSNWWVAVSSGRRPGSASPVRGSGPGPPSRPRPPRRAPGPACGRSCGAGGRCRWAPSGSSA